ncbi:MAG: ATP-dependent protease, partial [Candidatus Omnitrophota bacterium]
VMIPQSNVKHLMLKDEVIDAVKKGKFHIWPVSTVDEGIEILTGKKAGKKDAKGKYPHGTINYLADKKLKEYSRKFAAKRTREKKGRSRKK